MKFLFRKQCRNCIIAGMILAMLFGCASIKEMNVSQKYENSKGWFKEKWQAIGSKFSSSEDEEKSIEPHHQKPDYWVYETQWSYETLSGIAEWFTGDSENWKAITAANPKVSPKRIAAGTEILIPAKLIKNKNLPTEDFVAKHRILYFEHRVKWSGETLALIAKWYTGRYGNWRAIARANPGLNPNRIAVGNIIYVPPEMMKTQKPLPQKVVAKTLPGYFSHTVTRPDEKFTDIARWYTGDAENHRPIAKANPDIDPEFLLVGNEIYIPSALLKTHRSMYSKSDRTSVTEPDKKSLEAQITAPTPPASEPKKIQLFGPKQFPDR
jgi:hypothetical protein